MTDHTHTIPVTVHIDHALLARLIVEEQKNQGLVIVGPAPDTVMEASEVMAALGRGPGRPMSYPTLQKRIVEGHLHPIPGDDRRRLYFQRSEVEALLGKK